MKLSVYTLSGMVSTSWKILQPNRHFIFEVYNFNKFQALYTILKMKFIYLNIFAIFQSYYLKPLSKELSLKMLPILESRMSIVKRFAEAIILGILFWVSLRWVCVECWNRLKVSLTYFNQKLYFQFERRKATTNFLTNYHIHHLLEYKRVNFLPP